MILSRRMTQSGKKALMKIACGEKAARASVDDLQSLLLQIVFALLMIFIIAYFIFVEETKKERAEQVLDLNRQKLVLALEKTVENHRIKYGLNALMTQGIDGSRIFDASSHVHGGALSLAPAAAKAFSAGSAAAFQDYSDAEKLHESWVKEVMEAAAAGELGEEEKAWLNDAVAERIEMVRLDTRGVQRALAARLQESLIESSSSLGTIEDANALAEAIKLKSLEMIKKEIGAEVLP